MDPLFSPSEAYLRARVKLSSVTPGTDIDATIDHSVFQVRLEFYRALGKPTVDDLLTTAHTETPSTEAEIRRALATSVEVSWVKMYLLRALNVLFMESSGSARRDWNEAPLLRQSGTETVRLEIERLERDVQYGLMILRGDVDLGSESKDGVAHLIAPDVPGPLPGDYVKNPYPF